MSKKDKIKENELTNEGVNELENEGVEAAQQAPNAENAANDANDETEELKARIAELEDKNLRMMAEFDNYRRRTNKEKLELIETAGERIFTDMLPLLDDMERAMKAMENVN